MHCFHKTLVYLMSEKQLYEAEDKEDLFLPYKGHLSNYYLTTHTLHNCLE